MSILIDYNQMAISKVTAFMGKGADGPLSPKDFRYLILDSILFCKNKFSKDYGDIVICCDSKSYWRKQAFPYYKAGRKKMRETSKLDWKLIMSNLDSVKAELKESFPYKVIEIEGAEADDIIAVICKHTAGDDFGDLSVGIKENNVIVSRDKDYSSLQRYPNVRQYCTVTESFMKCDDPIEYLKLHVLRGDAGDGIPNVLSQDDIFLIEGKRQNVLTQKRIDKILSVPFKELDEDLKKNIKRNRQVIDFAYIPLELRTKIINEFEEPLEQKPRDSVFNYIIQNRLRNLLDKVSEF